MSDTPESDLVRDLRQKAGKKSEDRFTVTHGDVVVGVSYSGGSSSSLSLHAKYDLHAKRDHGDGRDGGSYRQTAVPRALVATRPMQIVLRPEAYGDIQAKEQGVNREHQTGDATFDDAVYVDSPTTENEVLRAILNPEVRAAVRDLFALGLRRITIDDTLSNVEAYVSEFATAQEKPNRAELMLDAFARLLSSVPAVRDSGAVHAPAPFGWLTGLGGVLAAILGLGAIPLFFLIASGFDCTESSADGEGSSLKSGCGGPPLTGLFAGIAAGVLALTLAHLLIAPKLRGRSDSASRIFKLSIISYALVAEVTFLIVTYIGYAVR